MDNIALIPQSYLTAIAFLVLGGAIAKSAQLPLFTWLYGAMEAPNLCQRSTSRCHYGQGRCLPYCAFHFHHRSACSDIAILLPTVSWVGVLTAFVGATLALSTPDIKGVLAYSTVSQLVS